jgi:hypothetical protein
MEQSNTSTLRTPPVTSETVYEPPNSPWTIQTAEEFLTVSIKNTFDEIEQREKYLLNVYQADNKSTENWDKKIGMPSDVNTVEVIAKKIKDVTEWILKKKYFDEGDLQRKEWEEKKDIQNNLHIFTPRKDPWTLETASNFLFISEKAKLANITNRRDKLLSLYQKDACNGENWDEHIGIPSIEYNCDRIATEINSAADWMLIKRYQYLKKLKEKQREEEKFLKEEREKIDKEKKQKDKTEKKEKKEREKKDKEDEILQLKSALNIMSREKNDIFYKTSAGIITAAGAVGVAGYGAYKLSKYMRKAEIVVNLADTTIVDILATVVHLKQLVPSDNKDLLYQTNDSIRQLQDMIKATTVANKIKTEVKTE